MRRTMHGLLMAGAAAAAMIPMFATSSQAAEGPVPSAEPTANVVDAVEADEADLATLAAMPCVSATGAKACFKHYGDKIYVKDTKADGYSAVGNWATDYGRSGWCRNALGSGKWGVCNYNMKEGRLIAWQALRYNGDTGKFVGPRSTNHVATI